MPPSITPPATCPVCHQPVLPAYYFCPNCGAALQAAPLPTSPGAQAGLYAFSIVLPMICFLMISKWQGLKYYRSSDPKARQMGTIAFVLIVLSTLVTLYYAYALTQALSQSLNASVNADLSAQGP